MANKIKELEYKMSKIVTELETLDGVLRIISDKTTANKSDLVELDKERKSTQGSLDNTLSQINQASKQVGECFKQGKAEEANALKASLEAAGAVVELK